MNAASAEQGKVEIDRWRTGRPRRPARHRSAVAHRVRATLLARCALLGTAAQARIVERQIDVAVSFLDADGKTIAQGIKVNVFVDDVGYGVSGGQDVEDSGPCSRGGNPKDRPAAPCAHHLVERLVVGCGSTARIPTLWIDAENDHDFGPRVPQQWFDAVKAAGAPGEFIQFPPHGEDGHRLFGAYPSSLHPPVLDFLRRLGFDIKENL